MPTGEPAGSIPNVGLFRCAIKGKGTGSRCGSSQPVICRQLFLEQFVGSAAVPCGIGHMLLDAGDFALQRLDPGGQFVDGKRPEVLLDHLGQRILRPAGKEVILVHADNVDPCRAQVNKARNYLNGGVDE